MIDYIAGLSVRYTKGGVEKGADHRHRRTTISLLSLQHLLLLCSRSDDSSCPYTTPNVFRPVRLLD